MDFTKRGERFLSQRYISDYSQNSPIVPNGYHADHRLDDLEAEHARSSYAIVVLNENLLNTRNAWRRKKIGSQLIHERALAKASAVSVLNRGLPNPEELARREEALQASQISVMAAYSRLPRNFRFRS